MKRQTHDYCYTQNMLLMSATFLCTTHYSKLQCQELWFQTGVQDKAKYIHIHSLAYELGPELCNALLGFHILTRYDSNCTISGLGKNKGLDVLLGRKEHQNSLGQFGEETELSNSTLEACEALIVTVYSKAEGTGRKLDNVRYCLFCQKGQRYGQYLPYPIQLTATREARKLPGICMEESTGTYTESANSS